MEESGQPVRPEVSEGPQTAHGLPS